MFWKTFFTKGLIFLFFFLSTGQTWTPGSSCTKGDAGSPVWSSWCARPPQVSRIWAEIYQKAPWQTAEASGLLYGHKGHLEQDRHSQTHRPPPQSHHKCRCRQIQASCKSSEEPVTDCCSKNSHFYYILPVITAHHTIHG